VGPEIQRTQRRRALVSLCVTQITSWGVIYYAFPVLAPSVARDNGWSITATTWAFSAGLITSAGAGIIVGRWLDRRGPRLVMTTGSVLGVVALVIVALAHSYGLFLGGWVIAGLAMAGTFYPPAFAALTRWYGPDRVRALTTLTLVGGLASTVFAPLTSLLDEHLQWRTTYLVLACVVGLVTIPLHAGLRFPWPPAHRARETPADASAAAIARSRPFLTLVAAMALAGFGVYAVVVNQLGLLDSRGLPTTLAGLALGLGGLGQVLGRLGYTTLNRLSSPRTRTVTVLGACAITIALLAALTGPLPLLIAATTLAGMARGLFTLLQATAVSDRWNTAVYGRLSGLLAPPITVATAVARGAGAALAAALGGYPQLFWLLTGVAVLGALAAVFTTPSLTPERNEQWSSTSTRSRA
jgi:MFS family permease